MPGTLWYTMLNFPGENKPYRIFSSSGLLLDTARSESQENMISLAPMACTLQENTRTGWAYQHQNWYQCQQPTRPLLACLLTNDQENMWSPHIPIQVKEQPNQLLKEHCLSSSFLEMPCTPRGTLPSPLNRQLLLVQDDILDGNLLTAETQVTVPLKITFLFSFIFHHTCGVRFFEPGFFLPYSCVAATLGHGGRWAPETKSKPVQFLMIYFLP